MENQHRKISGYRELSQIEIDLVNRIKAKGEELLRDHAALVTHLQRELECKRKAELFPGGPNEALDELHRFEAAEPLRWASIGKTHIQQGVMALVRAVAQPGE